MFCVVRMRCWGLGHCDDDDSVALTPLHLQQKEWSSKGQRWKWWGQAAGRADVRGGNKEGLNGGRLLIAIGD